MLKETEVLYIMKGAERLARKIRKGNKRLDIEISIPYIKSNIAEKYLTNSLYYVAGRGKTIRSSLVGNI